MNPHPYTKIFLLALVIRLFGVITCGSPSDTWHRISEKGWHEQLRSICMINNDEMLIAEVASNNLHGLGYASKNESHRKGYIYDFTAYRPAYPVYMHIALQSFYEKNKISLLANANVFSVDMFNYNKLVVIAIFMQAAVLFFLKKRDTEGLWMLLLLPVVFISTSVSIYSAVFIFLLYRYFKNRDIKEILPCLGMMAGLALFFLFFYKTDQAGQTIQIRKLDGGISSLITLSYIKTAVNIIGLTCIQLAVIFLPAAIILIPTRKTLWPLMNPFKNDYLLLAVLVFVISLVSWAAFHYMVDTVQLFSNISIVMIIMLFFIAFQIASKAMQYGLRHILSVAVMLIMFWKLAVTLSLAKNPWPQSDEYLVKTSAALSGINPIGAFLLSDSSYNSVFSKNPIFNIAGKHLAYANSNAYTYSLSVYNTPVSGDHPETDKQLIARAAFWRFTEDIKDAGVFKSIADAQVLFIQQFKIDYLITDGNVTLDPELAYMVRNEITDAKTGEHFYLLNRKMLKQYQK